jgi:hypothetical protein
VVFQGNINYVFACQFAGSLCSRGLQCMPRSLARKGETLGCDSTFLATKPPKLCAIRTILLSGELLIEGEVCIAPRRDSAISCTLRMLPLVSCHVDLYPKLWTRTFWKAGSFDNHSLGQK